MSCIGWDRSLDPVLHDLYARNLLKPGWAGEVDGAEAAYIARELTKRPALRRVWQVAKFTRRRRSITPAMAKKMAHWWAGINSEAIKPRFSGTVRLNKRASGRKSLGPARNRHEAGLSTLPRTRLHRGKL